MKLNKYQKDYLRAKEQWESAVRLSGELEERTISECKVDVEDKENADYIVGVGVCADTMYNVRELKEKMDSAFNDLLSWGIRTVEKLKNHSNKKHSEKILKTLKNDEMLTLNLKIVEKFLLGISGAL
jgi:predicted DNA-binding protein